MSSLCAFRCLRKASGLYSFSESNSLVRNYLFLKKYVTSEVAVSHIVFYYQQLSIASYQVSFFIVIYILSNNQLCPVPLNRPCFLRLLESLLAPIFRRFDIGLVELRGKSTKEESLTLDDPALL